MGIVVVQKMGLFGLSPLPPAKVRKGLWVYAELESAGPVSSVGFMRWLARKALCLHPAWQTSERVLSGLSLSGSALPEASAELSRLTMGRRVGALGALAPSSERLAAVCACCAACGSSLPWVNRS